MIPRDVVLQVTSESSGKAFCRVFQSLAGSGADEYQTWDHIKSLRSVASILFPFAQPKLKQEAEHGYFTRDENSKKKKSRRSQKPLANLQLSNRTLNPRKTDTARTHIRGIFVLDKKGVWKCERGRVTSSIGTEYTPWPRRLSICGGDLPTSNFHPRLVVLIATNDPLHKKRENEPPRI